MRVGRRAWALAAVAGLVLAGCAAATAQPAPAIPYVGLPGTRIITPTGAQLAQCPWLNASLPVAQRVRMLVGHMTLSDEIRMMYGTAPFQNAGTYEGYVPGTPQLCIPALTEEDGPLGVGNVSGVTALPSAEALAATWSRQAARNYGVVNGREHWAKGMDVALGPTINILRVPQWGRGFETLGEDPYLTAQLATAEVDGIQSQGVIAQAKHLAAYNQEADRGSVDVQVSRRALEEIYLPAFRAVVRQGQVGSLMCAYPQTNGAYDCANPLLIHTVVDGRWGFLGWVGSDYGATHSTAASANAGLGQEMGDGGAFFGHGLLAEAVAQNKVAASTIVRDVSGTLYEMFRFGLFNRQPTGTIHTPAATKADTAMAETLAAEGIVLLQNRGHLLPLAASSVHSIAVIGADAGSGALAVSPPPSSAHVVPPFVVTPLTAIGTALTPTKHLLPTARIVYADGSSLSQAAQAARQAQVAVVFADNVETEGTDLASLSLPGGQNALISAVAQANPHTVVVLNTGGPVLMPWVSQVQSVLEAWYPGEEDGTAIASVLFGKTDPGGHLPMTFPASASATPLTTTAEYPGVNGVVSYSDGLDVGYRWYEVHHVQPLFPFGFGLSYTTFSFRGLSVSPTRVATAGPAAGCTPPHGLWSRLVGSTGTCLARVAVTVTNTGRQSGSDVVQLYLGDPASTGEPPRQLKGFQRVTLAPGQSQRVVFYISPRDAAYWNSPANAFVVARGTYTVYVGDASARQDLPLSADFRVASATGPQPITVDVPPNVTAPATVDVTASLHNASGVADHQLTLSLHVGTGGAPTPEASAAKAFAVQALCGKARGPGSPASASCPAVATLGAGQTITARWQLVVPADVQAGSYHYDVSARYQTAKGDVNGGGSATAQVEPCCVLGGKGPVLLEPGHSGAVSVTLADNSTRSAVSDLRLSLQAPTGYGVAGPAATSAGTVAPGASTSATFTLTAPAAPTGGPVSLEAVAAYRIAGQQLQTRSPIIVQVPYPSLSAAYDNVGVTTRDATSAGNLDGQQDSYSASALAAAGLVVGKPIPGEPGLIWPNVAPGQPDNVVASGQAVALTGSGSSLVIVGAGDFANTPSLPVPGSASGQGRIMYANGSEQSFTLSLADWYNNAAGPGQSLVARTAHWNQQGGAGTSPVSVYAASIPLRPGQAVAAVVLPDVSSGVAANETAMHIFAMAIR